MDTAPTYSVTLVPDEEGEQFSPSSCDCTNCKNMHFAQNEWDTFIPSTRLQLRMKEVVAQIESNIAKETL